MRVLRGEDPEKIPVIRREAANKFMFDYHELSRFGLSVKDLPDGSEVINSHPSFYVVNKMYIWGGIVSLLIFSCIIVLLGINILVRKRVKEALRESKHRFIVFMEHLPAAVFIKDQSGHLLFANRYLQEILGWKEFIAKTTEELLPRGMAMQMITDDYRILTEGPMVIQERIIDIRGAEHFFNTYKFPILAGGASVLLGGIAVDMTKRIKMERDLANTKVLLQSAFEQTPVPMVLVSAPDGTVLNVNRACVEMIGVEDEGEPVGQSLAGLNPTWQDFDEEGKRIPWTRNPRGEGWGLQQCSLGIVHGHKGAIKVYSEPGKGTTIKTLPSGSLARALPGSSRSPTPLQSFGKF